MLKRLTILAVLAICAGIVSGQTNRNTSPNQQPTKQEQPALHSANGEQGQGKATGVSQGWYASLKWPEWLHDSNWWLVTIAGCTGLVIGWQSFETRKAAQGAKENAESTAAQIEIMKSKERARVA